MLNEEQIQNIIDRLEKLEIIGENVLKYWENDKIQCILKIKNLEYKIKTTKIEATDKDREEYKMHINDLLKLGVIRRSESPHRSSSFLVNKHSEQKRGKSRMVITYKRLNDNTEDDGYDIPTKEYLLGKIKNCNIFSVAPLFGSTRLTGPNRIQDALIPLYHFIKIIYQKHVEALHFSWHKSHFKYAEAFLKG